MTRRKAPAFLGTYVTLAVLAANWLVDLVYLWLDARTRDAGS